MRGVIAIPDGKTNLLMQEVAGVPLLVRVILTAARAGVDEFLIIWPEGVSPRVLEPYAESSAFRSVKIDSLRWDAIAGHLEGEFLWLPWNWVTHKRVLAGSAQRRDGVAVTSPAAVPAAERFLVANSGKPLDGMYSKFNRRLCRPFVRLLTHTPVTPNAVTLAGLLAAILAAIMFARGSYFNYLAGALLFFASGLFDEMDGMLARLKFRESAFGTWFEGFVDNATYLLVFSGIIVGLHREHGSFALRYGAALIVGCVLSVIAIALQRRLATAADRPHEYAGRMKQLLAADSSNPVSRIVKHISLFVTKAVLINYLLIFTLIGRLDAFLWLAAIGSNLTWIFTLYFSRRFFRSPRPDRAPVAIEKAAWYT